VEKVYHINIHMEKALELEPQVQIFERDNIKKKSAMPMAHLPIC
jgi:hypothetical protein